MPDTAETPLAIGSPPGAFRLALQTLRDAGSRTVLDCPSGEGPFSKMLMDAGFETSCCDIFPDQFKVEGLTCTLGDMNDSLPYDDESFDAITCLNGLQRVWARGRAVREFNRILKPGGTLVISYPNQGDMRRRMLNFMTGSVTWNVIGPPHTCDPAAEPPASNFRYAMTTANVLSSLESTGFEPVSLQSTHYTKGALLMSPLALLPKLASLLAPSRQKQHYFLRWSSTTDALLGAFLVLVARKTETWTPPTLDGREAGLTNR